MPASLSRPGLPRAPHLLHRLFGTLVVEGTLSVEYSDGRRETYGSGEPFSAIAFTSPEAERALLLRPSLKLGECYMEGGFVLRRGDIYDLLHVLLGNRHKGRLPAPLKAAKRLARMLPDRINDAHRARANVAHHYDLDRRLYDLFLDGERQYSCAYFERPEMTLDEAQRAKLARIARKLALRPGQRVLDIGSGWGGLALHLAREHDVQVTGITLSEEQLAAARRRAAEAGLGHRVRYELADYRQVEGRFDRVVSVGMLEHVGRRALGGYFARVAELLEPQGLALIHSIGGFVPPYRTNPWIRKYIFPGGCIPALSEALVAIEHSGLMVSDIEIWRLHYAETLRHWRERFTANRALAAEIYDERFCRMWEFYLAASEASFRVGPNMVFQVQLLKDREAAPPTRRYMEPD